MKKLTVILLALIPFYTFCQETGPVQLNDDLKDIFNVKRQPHEIPDEEIDRIATEAALKAMGIDVDVFYKARELEKKEQDAVFDNTEATMIKDTIIVSDDPSVKTPVIYTTPGHSTFVNVIDQTGQPWPVVLAESGNANLFTTEAVDEHKYKNIFKIIPKYRVGTTNLTLLVAGKPITMSIKLQSTKERYHPHPILQITANGPLAKAVSSSSSHVKIKNGSEMAKLLYLNELEGFKRLKTDHNNTKLWKKGDRYFVKTKMTPINPRGEAGSHGPNGYSIYELKILPVLVMLDSNGIEQQINVIGDY